MDWLQKKNIYTSNVAVKGEMHTSLYSAKPGQSEHQTGLAMDISSPSVQSALTTDVENTPEGRWLRENAAAYGFILRYPAGKEHITGYAYEPWHFRYVGIPHAAVMAEMDFTLEEYTAFLKGFPYGSRPFVYEEGQHRFEISFLAADAAATLSPTKDGAFRVISGNNVDGCVLTNWRKGD